MKGLIISAFIAFMAIGYALIGEHSLSQFTLYTIFLSLNTGIILFFIKDGVRKNLISLYTFIAWMIYNTLGFLHVTYVEEYFVYDNTIAKIYFLLIGATLLLFIPILFAKKYIKKGFRRLNNLRLSYRVIVVFLAIDVAFSLYEVYVGGGFSQYFYSSYGAKVDDSLRTFFQLFGGILGNAGMFVMPLIFGNYGTKKKIVGIAYILFGLLMSIAGGHSGGMMGTFLGLFIFGYFATNSKKIQNKLRMFALIAIPLGVIGGILLRINRKDMANFSFESLNGSITEIMTSPTFDNVTNLGYVLENMKPTYSPGQFIYPFINFLPRAVFPWKPMELGRIVGMKSLGTSEDSLAGFIPSPLGEFYYDFGYLGIILGMLFVGFVIGYVQVKLNNTRPQSVWILSFITKFGGSASILYAWYTGMFNGLVRWMIFLIIFFIVNNTYRHRYLK